MKIGIILIATNKYKQFLPDVIGQYNKNFLINHEKRFFVFIDDLDYKIPYNAVKIKIPSYKFPEATLYRYKIITENAHMLQGMDHLYYSDVDMSVVNTVDEEVINPVGLVAVQHPGFYPNKRGTYETRKESLAYLENNKHPYVAGGFQGGCKEAYLGVSEHLYKNIEQDGKNNMVAVWHDESHWNWYVNNTNWNLRILSPSYVYSERFVGQFGLQPKIVALDKDHNFFRS